MSYTQLSTAERFELHRLRSTTGLSLHRIAKQMGRAQSTLSRELQRNRIEGDIYLPDTAHKQMEIRRQGSKWAFMSVSESCLEEVKQRLENYHSPDKIAGRMKREGIGNISYETIY